MCSRTCKICEVTYERIWLQDRPTRTIENPKNDFCGICGLLYYLDRDLGRLAYGYDFTEMPANILGNLEHGYPKLFTDVTTKSSTKRSAPSPKTDDFETSSKYMKDRRHLEIIEALTNTKPFVSEYDVVKAIQTNLILNPMKYSDTPVKTAILKSLRTLQELSKITTEANYMKLATQQPGRRMACNSK